MAEIEVTPAGPGEREAWNGFIDAAPTGHVFQTWEWGEFKRAAGWEPFRLLARRAGAIVGAVSILKKRLPLGRSLLYASRGPVIAEKESLEPLAAAIRDLAVRSRAVFARVSPEVAGDGWEERFDRSGFRRAVRELQHRTTIRIDLSRSLDDILKAMEGRTRSAIRKAEKTGLAVENRDDAEAFEVFAALYDDLARRKTVTAMPHAHFAGLATIVGAAGRARVFVARLGGEPVAGALIVTSANKAWYLYGATLEKGRGANPTEAIQWAVIRWAQKQGLTWYDLQGIPDDPAASPSARGLYLFKRGFGGNTLAWAGEYDYVASPLLYRLWDWLPLATPHQ